VRITAPAGGVRLGCSGQRRAQPDRRQAGHGL